MCKRNTLQAISRMAIEALPECLSLPSCRPRHTKVLPKETSNVPMSHLGGECLSGIVLVLLQIVKDRASLLFWKSSGHSSLGRAAPEHGRLQGQDKLLPSALPALPARRENGKPMKTLTPLPGSAALEKIEARVLCCMIRMPVASAIAGASCTGAG